MLTSVRRDIQNHAISGEKIYGGVIDHVDAIYSDRLVVPKNGKSGFGSINGQLFSIGSGAPIGAVYSALVETPYFSIGHKNLGCVGLFSERQTGGFLELKSKYDNNKSVMFDISSKNGSGETYADLNLYSNQTSTFGNRDNQKKFFSATYDTDGNGGKIEISNNKGHTGFMAACVEDESANGWTSLMRWDIGEGLHKCTQHSMNYEDEGTDHGTATRWFSRRGSIDWTGYSDYYAEINTKNNSGGAEFRWDNGTAGSRRLGVSIENDVIKTYDWNTQKPNVVIGNGVSITDGYMNQYTRLGDDIGTLSTSYKAETDGYAHNTTTWHRIDVLSKNSYKVASLSTAKGGRLEMFAGDGSEDPAVDISSATGGYVSVNTLKSIAGGGGYLISGNEISLYKDGLLSPTVELTNSTNGGRLDLHNNDGEQRISLRQWSDGTGHIYADQFHGTFVGSLESVTSTVYKVGKDGWQTYVGIDGFRSGRNGNDLTDENSFVNIGTRQYGTRLTYGLIESKTTNEVGGSPVTSVSISGNSRGGTVDVMGAGGGTDTVVSLTGNKNENAIKTYGLVHRGYPNFFKLKTSSSYGSLTIGHKTGGSVASITGYSAGSERHGKMTVFGQYTLETPVTMIEAMTTSSGSELVMKSKGGVAPDFEVKYDGSTRVVKVDGRVSSTSASCDFVPSEDFVNNRGRVSISYEVPSVVAHMGHKVVTDAGFWTAVQVNGVINVSLTASRICTWSVGERVSNFKIRLEGFDYDIDESGINNTTCGVMIGVSHVGATAISDFYSSQEQMWVRDPDKKSASLSVSMGAIDNVDEFVIGTGYTTLNMKHMSLSDAASMFYSEAIFFRRVE